MRSLAAGLLLVVVPAISSGHPLAPSLLEVEERSPGQSVVRWKTPAKRVPGSRLAPLVPETCELANETLVEATPIEVVTAWDLRCDEPTLVGLRFGVEGIATSKANVLLRVALLDGRRVLRVLRPDEPTVEIPDRPGPGAVLGSYARLGVEHILSGFDHLCFVFGLVLLVGWGRSLVWTVTSFTVGHSITLSMAVLGFVNFPSRPIEIAIAFSIYLLALELVRGQQTLLGRRPRLMAATFGLLHGFGFAGALSEVGLPPGDIPLALLAFNVGIEVGQLAFVVGVVALGYVFLPRGTALRRFIWVPAYGIGSLAAYWTLRRLLMPGG